MTDGFALDRLSTATAILEWMEQESYEYARLESVGTSALIYEYEDHDGESEYAVVAVTQSVDDFTTELIDLWEQATALESLICGDYEIENDQDDADPPWKPGNVRLVKGGVTVHTVVGASTMTRAIRDLNRAVYMERLMSGEVKSAEC